MLDFFINLGVLLLLTAFSYYSSDNIRKGFGFKLWWGIVTRESKRVFFLKCHQVVHISYMEDGNLIAL